MEAPMRYRPTLLLLPLITAIIAFSGCTNVETANKNSASTDPSNATAAAGKIPITTSSEEARKEFIQGRDLNEKLLVQDSIAHYDKAISLDANFAYAELNRAGVSPTGKEFFDHLKKAVGLADKASNGEKLLILGTEAGANGNAAKQKEYFGQQDFPQAITYYKKATELEPKFSSAFNLLGYAYRQNDDYANSENAFKKY